MGAALAFAIELFNAVPALVAAGVDIVAFVKKTEAKLQDMKEKEREPTDAEWDELNVLIENLRAQRPVV